jgi:hypothetical protein
MTDAARGIGPKTRLNLVAAVALLNLEEGGLRRSLIADLNTLGNAHDPPPAFLRKLARWQDVLEELDARLADPFLAAIRTRLPDLNRLAAWLELLAADRPLGYAPNVQKPTPCERGRPRNSLDWDAWMHSESSGSNPSAQLQDLEAGDESLA